MRRIARLASFGTGPSSLASGMNQTRGTVLEGRGSQATYSVLGQSAPADVKLVWNPEYPKEASVARVHRGETLRS